MFQFKSLFRFNISTKTNPLFNERLWFLIQHRLFLIFNDALLIDFLQKKIVDNWLRKFVITSANLLNERIFFSNLYNFYVISFLNPLKQLNLNYTDSISNLFTFFLLFSLLMLFITLLF